MKEWLFLIGAIVLETFATTMLKYSEQFTTKTVICYCHYCLEGLLAGGVDGHHLAELLFEPYSCK